MAALTGRVALITGAGRGIGREEALFFAGEGAKVVVNDPGAEPDGNGRDDSVAASVVEEIVAHGGTAVANTDSVSDWAGARRMVEAAIDTFGDLHVVVNNATIKADRAMTTMTEEQFDDVVAVKLKGTFAVSHWAARHWRQRHEAGDRTDRAIVNTSSGSGLVNPLPGQTNYAAANAGVAAMTISSALELGLYGVRVNCVSPSMARTRLTLDVPGMDNPGQGSFDPSHPRASAPVVAYLAAPDCPLTGQVLAIRGGTVVVNDGWSPGARVTKDDALWTVEELRAALDELTFTDQFDKLAVALGGALGATGREQIQQLIAAHLTEVSPGS
ncbi:SDR family NAD(P)-dependent oxidoreductase [Kibdelosporangium phytohabitans]|uniref:Short-chain dehydrogenase n=1 Tax=Kibdelosporangium phytohabitans TaxID=860235 RepID=A0A0N9I1K3_9PSEU|nr:SDR family NAD(P)-dependent oxidoreductase [Kibdelosporangium phytohabitans]ALG13800.1 short-chain dehydrogenase [Kibdelosporangium phytohabitans]MBE1467277.1 NAD(P)-dependent dehydrogenase (short-subunit alcohol dehydrogenase family) [Kibdelosporangium phytohabitans]